MNASPLKSLRRAAAIVGLATAAGGLTAIAVAAPHGPGGPEGSRGHLRGGPDGLMVLGERMLDDIEATPEQRAQIDQIRQAARADLQGQREAGRALRDQMRTLFTQPTVDAAAVEAVRQQMQAQRDRASQRLTQAMIDVSRVLTPAQRTQIAERLQQREQHVREHAERWQQHRLAREGGTGAAPATPQR